MPATTGLLRSLPMLYLANASSPTIRSAMLAGELGQMCTPRERRPPLPGVTWAADNGCYAKGYPGDARWLEWLTRHRADADRCLFATAPDVVGDAPATLARSAPLLPVVRDLGYPAALVAQDGIEDTGTPWGTFDVLFLGGSTGWKLSAAAQALTKEAVAQGVPVHMGRVNSRKRFELARGWGCRSVDGTALVFHPTDRLAEVRSWLSLPDP